MRLIDADALHDFVSEEFKDDVPYEWAWALTAIDHAPAVDAVPVVRCREWIPAEEPPKEYRDEYGELIPFLVCEEGTDYPFRAMYDGKTWGDGIFAIPVKWWMHLPAPPAE